MLNWRYFKMAEAYCVKCKKKGQKMKDPSIVKTKRGGYMAKGNIALEFSPSILFITSSTNPLIAKGAPAFN